MVDMIYCSLQTQHQVAAILDLFRSSDAVRLSSLIQDRVEDVMEMLVYKVPVLACNELV